MGAGASSSLIPSKVNKDEAKTLFADKFDEEKFDKLAGESGELTSEQVNDLLNSAVKNSALIFIKPHANTAATQSYVKERITSAGCTITFEGDISGVEIDEKKLIDNHYYAIASKATILKPKDLAVPADKFEEFFGQSWAEALEQEKVFNAIDACSKFECDAAQLERAWRQCEPNKKVIKFGGGFYCGLVEMDGKEPLYVFNAFFMAMRSQFIGESNSIHVYSVDWDPAQLAWKDFRGSLIGATDPSKADPASIRGQIAARYEEFGLLGPCSTGANGVHASASPLEGLAEKMNWLEKNLTDEPFGVTLLRNGLSEEVIRAWCRDARVKVSEEGEEAGIFDTVEDSDASVCAATCARINKLNN